MTRSSRSNTVATATVAQDDWNCDGVATKHRRRSSSSNPDAGAITTKRVQVIRKPVHVDLRAAKHSALGFSLAIAHCSEVDQTHLVGKPAQVTVLRLEEPGMSLPSE